MTDCKPDKKAESIKALKDANKHLAELFNDMAKKDSVLQSQASQISYVARQCGDLKIEVYVGADKKNVSLKSFLDAAAIALNEARS